MIYCFLTKKDHLPNRKKTCEHFIEYGLKKWTNCQKIPFSSFSPFVGNRLGVLPLELNKLLIIVVVLSMALTPALNEAGRKAAEIIDEKFGAEDVRSDSKVIN